MRKLLVPIAAVVLALAAPASAGLNVRPNAVPGTVIRELKSALTTAREYGAICNGIADDMAALRAADNAGPFILPPGICYVSGNPTFTNLVAFSPGASMFATGLVRFGGGVEAPERAYIFAGSASYKITVPQAVNADWWGPEGTSTRPSYRLKYAIENTARGTAIYVHGKTWTVPLTITTDEDHLDADTNRDMGKSLLGVGAPGTRLQDTAGEWGAEVYLANGQNTHLLTLQGVRRSNGQPPRFSVTISGIKWNGNMGQQNAGDCIYADSVKDVYLGTTLVEDCYATGVEFASGVNDSSNQVFGDHLEITNVGDDGFRQAGLGDTEFDLIVIAVTGDDGLVIGSGMTLNEARVGIGGGQGIVFTGDEVNIGSIRVDDYDQSCILYSATASGVYVGGISAKRCGCDPDTGVDGSAILFSGATTGNRIGAAYIQAATATATCPTVAGYDIFFNDDGTGDNRVYGYRTDGLATVRGVNLALSARTIGNSVSQPKDNPITSCSTSITPDPTLGQVIEMTLTGACSVHNPSAAAAFDGERMTFVIHQDATGGRLMTHQSAWTDFVVDTAPSSTTTLEFVDKGNNLWYEVKPTKSIGDHKTVTVNGATTFAYASGYMVLACTGPETIDTITGGTVGTVLVLENTDTDCTITDDDPATAADGIDLNGTGANNLGATNNRLMLVHNGSNWVQIGQSTGTTSSNLDIRARQSFSCASNGTPASRPTCTLTPTTSYVECQCNDVDGCDITLDETGAVEGQMLTVVSLDAQYCSITESAGVAELSGSATLGQYDAMHLVYIGDRWVQVNNESDN